MQALAQELQSLHFTDTQESTRKVASELRAILISLEGACLAHESGTVSSILYCTPYNQVFVGCTATCIVSTVGLICFSGNVYRIARNFRGCNFHKLT